MSDTPRTDAMLAREALNPRLSGLGEWITFASQLERELAAALALSEERREMLEKHQWADVIRVSDSCDYLCIECHRNSDDGHAHDCELARLIRKEK